MTAKHRLVVIVDDKGKSVGTHEIAEWASQSWDAAKAAYNHYEADGMEIVEIPQNLAEFRKVTGKRGVNTCLYQATSDYLSHMLGITLHNTDKRFFETHPLVTPDGVSAGDTLRIVQELVAPYGLGIVRARLIPGLIPMGDLAQWVDILGVNPMSLGNFSVSNRFFAEQTGMPLTEVEHQFRLDFSEEPLRPAVVCGVRQGVWEDKKSRGSITYNFGHAEYCPPRALALAGDMVQVQLLPATLLTWGKQPNFAPVSLIEIPDVLELDLSGCRDKEGKELWKRFPAASGGRSSPKGGFWPWQRGNNSNTTNGMSSRLCVGCKETRKPKHLIPESGYMVCNPCWVTAWHKFVCYKCKHQFGKGAPTYIGVLSSTQKKLVGKCPKCTKLVQLADSDNKSIIPIVDGVLEARKKDGKDEPPADYKAFD